jgi:putative ABC transport system permease protein
MRLRKRMLDDLDRDIRDHIAQETQDNIDRGMSPEEARYAALRKFGNVTRVKEDSREVWILRWLEELLQDLRFGLRMLRKNPGFTAVAVLTLALGIGANTAIFSVVNGILIEHLPYKDSSRLATIRREQIAYPISFDEVEDIRRECPAFESIALYHQYGPLILGGATPERRSSSYVSGDFFLLLGVDPLLGRLILPEDTKPGQPQVTVLSYRLWMDQFGGDQRILGREIIVEKDLYTVIGVMPREFEMGADWMGDSNEGLWVPQVPSAWNPRKSGRPGGEIIARVKKGVTRSEVDAQLQVLSDRFAGKYPKGRRGVQLGARAPGLDVFPALRAGLLILFGAVGIVLLMASVNVSALLMARARTRQNELAIRAALGASRLRIVRQLFSESMLLALAGGAFGLLFSVWGIRVLRAIAPPGTPRVDRFHVDSNVLWFTLGISLLAAILFGLLPALQASSRRLWGVLQGGLGGAFAGTVTRQRRSVRSALVIAEVALAVVLVVSGALMARSFQKLMNVNTGVRADHVLTLWVQLSDFGCAQKEGETECPPKTQRILDGINALPGMERAVLSMSGPLQGGMIWDGKLYVEGVQGELSFRGSERAVAPDFFATVGMHVLAGRDFMATDLEKGHAAAIVSDKFARMYVPGNPLGKRFSTHDDKNGQHVWMEIVGVVNDTRDRAVTEMFDDPPYYTPFYSGNSRLEIIARTSVEPMSMAKAIEGVVWSVDKNAPITNVATLDQVISNSAAQPRFQAFLLGTFGALALALAIIGIYGVVSYSVVQRTHEIGIRMALGARPHDVMQLVIIQGGLLASIGIVFGLAGAMGVTRVLRTLLFEIKPTDPVTFVGVAILLLIVAVLASYFPARRAMRVDPMIALRHE